MLLQQVSAYGRYDCTSLAICRCSLTFEARALCLQALYVHTAKNVLIEVNPQIRLPRTFKRFCGLMVQLLQKLSIRATNGPDKLLKVSLSHQHQNFHSSKPDARKGLCLYNFVIKYWESSMTIVVEYQSLEIVLIQHLSLFLAFQNSQTISKPSHSESAAMGRPTKTTHICHTCAEANWQDTVYRRAGFGSKFAASSRSKCS